MSISSFRPARCFPQPCQHGHCEVIATPPEPTKAALRQQLTAHARAHWPQLADLDIRRRGGFAYVAGELADGTTMPLFRLRYNGSARFWGFAIYLASKDKYEESFLPSGMPAGTPQEALDCACGLYLNNPAAWLPWLPPTN